MFLDLQRVQIYECCSLFQDLESAIQSAFNDLKARAAEAPANVEALPVEDDVVEDGVNEIEQFLRFVDELNENSFPEALAKRAWDAKVTDIDKGICKGS